MDSIYFLLALSHCNFRRPHRNRCLQQSGRNQNKRRIRAIPKELQRSIWLETGCSDANLESGLQLFSLTKRAFLGAQVKYRVPLNVPSVQPAHSSSWKKASTGSYFSKTLKPGQAPWKVFPNELFKATNRMFAKKPGEGCNPMRFL